MSDDTVYDPNTMTRVPIIRPGTSFSDNYDDNSMYPESDIRNPGPPPASRSVDKRKTMLAIILGGIFIAVVILGATLGGGSDSSPIPKHAVLATPPADLPTKCSEELVATSDGNEACMKICEPAECCDFPTNMPLSCLPGNEDRCLEYHASCVVLTGTPTDETPPEIPPAPADLDQLCSTESLATVDGFSECREACLLAKCCYEDDVPGCTAQVECKSYSPCLNLGATDHVNEMISKHIGDVCSAEKLKTPDGRFDCHQSCSSALCCFAPTGSENTCQHDDTSFCSQYDKCNELHTTVQEVEATVFEIREACNFYKTDTIEHTSYCELVCAKGSCCFSDEQECAADVQCNDYTPCQDISNGEEGTSTNSSAGHATKKDIRGACLGQSDKTQCRELCKPGLCCFDDDGECSDPSVDCNDFFDCYLVLDDDGSDETGTGTGSGAGQVTKQEIRNACLGESDKTQCRELCEPGLCCFDDDGECSDPSVNCLTFFDCYVVVGSSGGGNKPEENVVTKADVRKACLVNDKSQCEELCKDSKCCFDDSPTCEADCVTFFDCGVLYSGTS